MVEDDSSSYEFTLLLYKNVSLTPVKEVLTPVEGVLTPNIGTFLYEFIPLTPVKGVLTPNIVAFLHEFVLLTPFKGASTPYNASLYGYITPSSIELASFSICFKEKSCV